VATFSSLRRVANPDHARNRLAYESAERVGRYRSAAGLFPAEDVLFRRHIARGATVLDIGVGGGRTTEWLAAEAGRYVGVDYSAAMVAACRDRLPKVDVRVADATDLSEFPDDSFDVVVFSFNGIDCIVPEAARIACLREMSRVVRPDGTVIFSSHRPFVLVAPVGALRAASWRLRAARVARGLKSAGGFIVQLASSPDLWDGAGYYRDRTQAGNLLYAATPRRVAAQVREAGLDVVDQAGVNGIGTPWWRTVFTYYVCRPVAASQGLEPHATA